MDAILYIRWSTKDQSEGDSKERQTRLGTRIAAKHNWLIVETLIDHGKSAYHGRNRSAGGALYAIEERALRGELAGKVLIVEAMDRLSRQEPLESLMLLHQLTQRGLTVCESSSGTIYDAKKITEDWTKLVAVLARAAEAYSSSHDKSQRIASAWRATQTGKRTKDGRADPRLCPAWVEVNENGDYALIEHRADLVRTMFDMAANGHGLRSIASVAAPHREQHGWPEAEWDIRKVGYILNSRRCLGEYQGQMRTIEGRREDVGEPVVLFPPVVTTEQFYRAQAGLKSRKSSGGPRREVVNVLSHIARCQHHNDGENVPCNSRMSYRGQKRGPNQLVCSRFARAAGCSSNANYRYDDLLAGILDHVLELALPDRVERPNDGNLAIDKAELQAKQARLSEMADRLMERDDPTLEAAYERFRRRVDEDTRAIKERISASEQTRATIPPAEVAREARKLRDGMDHAENRRRVQVLLDQLIDVVMLDPVDRSATVVVLGGLWVLKLDRRGQLIQQVNATAMLNDDGHMESVATNGDPSRAHLVRRVSENVS